MSSLLPLTLRRPLLCSRSALTARCSTDVAAKSRGIISAARLKDAPTIARALSPFEFAPLWTPSRRRICCFGALHARLSSPIQRGSSGLVGAHCAIDGIGVERAELGRKLRPKNRGSYADVACARGSRSLGHAPKCTSEHLGRGGPIGLFADRHYPHLHRRHFSSGSNRRETRDPYLGRCKSMEDMVQVTCDHLDEMSPRGLSAFWTLTAKLLQKQGGANARGCQMKMHDDIDRILFCTLKKLGSFGYREFAQTTLGMAKIMKQVGGRKRGNYMRKYHQVLRSVFVDNKPRKKEMVLHSIATASIPVLPSFDPRSLSNFIYAFGLAEYVPEFDEGRTLYDSVATEAIPMLNDFNAHGLSNMLWAYAHVGSSNSSLFENAGDVIAAISNLDEFQPQAIANIAWAYATAGEPQSHLFQRFGDHMVTLDSLNTFDPQAISNIAWAYATAEEPHPQLFQRFGNHIFTLDSLSAFHPQAISNIAWAYATAEEPHPQLFQRFGDHIITLDSLNAFDPHVLANIVWAYATAGEPHAQLFQRFGDHIFTLDSLSAFQPQAITNIAWAYATAVEPHPQLFQRFSDYLVTLDNLNAFDPQQLATIAWAYATADESAAHTLFDDVITHALSLLQRDVISELTTMGFEPDEEVLTETGYRLDALVAIDGEKIGIEVDGPSHFAGRKPTGPTLLKRRQVTSLDGIRVVYVPYWEWDRMKKDSNKKQAYLRSLLDLKN
ncbi:hypothetical protein ACHAWF_013189 [Thalassiosira exigua]